MVKLSLLFTCCFLLITSLTYANTVMSPQNIQTKQNETTTPPQNIQAKKNEPVTKPETVKQFINDATITAKIKTDLLASQSIGSLSISVTTDKGVVTLNGKVESKQEKEEVVKVTMSVAGVKSVVDQLKIEKI